MSNLELLNLLLGPFFPLIIFILIILTTLALRSLWSRSTQSKIEFFSFKKAKTEYLYPERPHSNIFHSYLKLALMSNSYVQQELAYVVSSMTKEQIEARKAISDFECSVNLSLLLADPKSWVLTTLERELPAKAKEDMSFEILFQKFNDIFAELEDLLEIEFIPESK